MKAEQLDIATTKYRELQGVTNTLKSIQSGQILVKVEYLDKNKGSCTDERENHFRPHSDEFEIFLRVYGDRLAGELKSLGLELPEPFPQK